MSKVELHKQAPSFSLLIGEGESVNNESLRGKYVVLYFYPKDDTPGCTVEAKDFNDLKGQFAKQDAHIIGVSKDSLKSHEKFKSKYGLNFDLASDPEGEVCNNYGVWVEKSMFGKKYMGIQRATFLIDREGKIAHIWPKVSVKDHAQIVFNKVKELETKNKKL